MLPSMPKMDIDGNIVIDGKYMQDKQQVFRGSKVCKRISKQKKKEKDLEAGKVQKM